MLSYLNSKKYLLISIYFFILLITGFFVYPDYGISIDEDNTRINGFVSLKYIFEIFFPNQVNEIDKFTNIPSMSEWNEQGHGVIFDLPTAFLEFTLQIEDSRKYYLIRHFINFLFFIVAIYFFFLLINNRYNSWILAILGSAFLFLTPRIFAQSFYNNKDIIFMSLFIISIYAAVTFLQNPSYKNSVFLSISSALTIDVRILGIILPILILIFYTINIFQDINYRKNSLKPLIVFLILTPLFIILFWPYLWENPLANFVTTFKNLSQFDVNIYNFYLGEYIDSKRVPWHYPIIWIFVSTPLFYLSLFVIGFIFIFRRLIKRILKIEKNDPYSDFWRGDKEAQDLFFFLTFAAPLFCVIIFNSTLYDGWRHLYFIYPSFLMISLFGLHIIKILFFNKNKNILIILSFLLLSPTIIWMLKNHPYQYAYFNLLVGKNFNDKFDMDYWGLSNANALEHIAKSENRSVKISNIGTTDLQISRDFIPEIYRNKLTIINETKNSDYIINNYRNWLGENINQKIKIPINFEVFYEIKIDGVPINTIYKKME